jgi:hypothetical protein
MNAIKNSIPSEIKSKSFQFYDIVNKITKENFHNEDSIDLTRIQFRPEIFFGITIPKKFQVKFLEDDKTIVYPVGGHLCFYDVIREKTKYILLDRQLNINGFFTFNNLKYLIFEEKNVLGSRISFFDKNSNKLEQKSICLDGDAELIDLTASGDGIKCAIVFKNPEWKLSVWCLENFNLVSEIKVFVTSPFKKTINQVSFYPNSNDNLLLLGNSVLTSFVIKNEFLINKWNFELGSNYISHLWLNDLRILLGDDSGKIIIFNANLVEIENIINLASDFQNEKDLLSKFNQNNEDKCNIQKTSLENEDDTDLLNVKNNPSAMSFFNQESIKSTDSNEKNSLNYNSVTDIHNQSLKYNNVSYQEIESQIEVIVNQTHFIEINQIIEISNGFIALICRNKIGIYTKNLLNNYELNCIGILNLFDSSMKKRVLILFNFIIKISV